MHITPEQNKLLAKLANFILENEIWKHSLLNECEYNIRLFTMKTHIPYRRTIYYLNNAFKKLLGERYIYEQSRLKKLLNIYPGQTKCVPQPSKQKKTGEFKKYKRGPAKPRSEFGRKFLEHFGYGASENLNQYYFEYKYYQENKRCRWEEKEKEG